MGGKRDGSLSSKPVVPIKRHERPFHVSIGTTETTSRLPVAARGGVLVLESITAFKKESGFLPTELRERV